MACPHVSGVAALAISYAAQLAIQITPDQLKEAMYKTATPIKKEYLTGKKEYRRYVADIGPMQPMQMELEDYRGGMGAGQINAAALLDEIAGVGTPIHFPNIYVAEGESCAVVPSRYFRDGELNTYSVTIEKQDVATCENKDGKLIFKGLKSGTTTATLNVKGNTTEQHTFTITVRKGAGDNGWM